MVDRIIHHLAVEALPVEGVRPGDILVHFHPQAGAGRYQRVAILEPQLCLQKFGVEPTRKDRPDRTSLP